MTIRAIEECLSDAGSTILSSEPETEPPAGYIYADLPRGTAFAVTVSDDQDEVDRNEKDYAEAPADVATQEPIVHRVGGRVVIQLLHGQESSSVDADDQSLALRCVGGE